MNTEEEKITYEKSFERIDMENEAISITMKLSDESIEKLMERMKSWEQ